MIKFPKNLDLRRQVQFSSDNGTIWLGESRMLLLHTAAILSMRKELINSVGLEQTRRIFTRMGYESGLLDAELAKKIRGTQDLMDAFVVGPQLHMLEGGVIVTPLKIDQGDSAASFTAHRNDTTVATVSVGAFTTIEPNGFNVFGGFDVTLLQPIPVGVNEGFRLYLSAAPLASLTLSGGVLVEEIGG